MPINYKDYPINWLTEIRPAIIERAGDCCELCFLKNKTNYYRYKKNGKPYSETIENHRFPYDLNNYKKVKIILTVHHIDGNKKNNKPVNLIALCQRCHLRLDLEKHLKNRRKS